MILLGNEPASPALFLRPLPIRNSSAVHGDDARNDGRSAQFRNDALSRLKFAHGSCCSGYRYNIQGPVANFITDST